MTPDQLADLLGVAIAVPRLPDAACRGETWLADLDVRSPRRKIDDAIEVCLSCRALEGCSSWLDSLPTDQRPAGVVAGQLVDPAAYQTAKALMAAERTPKPSRPRSRPRGPQRPARRLLAAVEAAGAAGITVREAAAVLYGPWGTVSQGEQTRQCLQRMVRRGVLHRVDRGRAGDRGRVARYVRTDLEAVAS